MRTRYAEYLPGVRRSRASPPSSSTSGSPSYDLKCLGAALDANRDLKFTYLGLQILYDRYFLHVQGRRIELPQVFFMRVAMGLALNEPEGSAKRARSSSTTCSRASIS